MDRSVRYYPLVGLIVGGLCALSFIAAQALGSHMVAVLLSMAVSILVTGAFHEDGLADTFDGIGGGLTPEASLEIMKDSRLGTYGTIGLVIGLALKAAALIALPPALVVIGLVAGHGLSRLSSVVVIATSRYVRMNGKAKPVANGLSISDIIMASATGLLILAGLALWHPWQALAFALFGLTLCHLLMRLFFEPKLGGYTGDTLGAIQQASELGVYLGLLAWL